MSTMDGPEGAGSSRSSRDPGAIDEATDLDLECDSTAQETTLMDRMSDLSRPLPEGDAEININVQSGFPVVDLNCDRDCNENSSLGDSQMDYVSGAPGVDDLDIKEESGFQSDLERNISNSKCDSSSSTLNEDSQSVGYSLSRESSFAFLRETSTISNSSISSSQDYLTPRESVTSSSSDRSSRTSNFVIKPGELVGELVESPIITLPPTQIPKVSSSLQDGDGSHSRQPDEDSLNMNNVNEESHLNANITDTNTNSDSSIRVESQTNIEESPAPSQEIIVNAVSTSSEPQQTTASPAPSVDNSASTSSQSQDPHRPSVPDPHRPSVPDPHRPSVPDPTAAAAKPRVRKTPNDFIFGKVIGEGSYSTVYLAKEVCSQKEFAIKVCEKKHLIRERKTHFVMREKEVFMKLDHPFFVKLAYTFQDTDRLYYVLTYASQGEILGYLHKLSAFDVPCTRHYAAEIVLALEHLHGLGIVHRDLKPENILLSDDMHIKITDFGTSKILDKDTETKKKNSFVGTAEYVSPEVLNNIPANFGSDLWGLGCIIYQCLSGSLPFRSGNEYQTFQKIIKVEYEFPEGFNPEARDLVQRLLVLEPSERLGATNMEDLKAHAFFEGINWADLPTTVPPRLMPYLPATGTNPEFWGQEARTGFDDQRLVELITGQGDGTQSPELEEVVTLVSPLAPTEDRQKEALAKQVAVNPFHGYVGGHLILKQGFVDKRKGLFARKRMLLLTEGPHLYYVDAHNKVLKGEIPWSKDLRPEAKNFKIFFVHTPNRTYYLESRMPDAQMWVNQIQEMWKKHYDNDGKV